VGLYTGGYLKLIEYIIIFYTHKNIFKYKNVGEPTACISLLIEKLITLGKKIIIS